MRKDVAGPFPFLVSSIFFRLPALLGTVKDFVTTGWRLAAGFRGCKDFLGYNNTIKSNVNYRSSSCGSRNLHHLKNFTLSSTRRRLESLIKVLFFFLPLLLRIRAFNFS